MITLTVVALNNTPSDGSLQAHFDELGGLIGRAETNQLVLPDPERMVSRVTAQIVYRNGSFAIIDRGSNPITLNGRALASGREAPLSAGDRLGICGYELSVKVGAPSSASAPADPFADLLGPAAGKSSSQGAAFDPLVRGRESRPAPAPVAAPAGGIPMDWDPFAPHPARASSPGPASAPRRDALGLDLGAAAPDELVPGLAPSSGGASSLDQLFGLGPAGGGDPLKDSVLDAPMAQPNMSGDADPMRALRKAPKASAPSEVDHLSDLNRPFIPPTTLKPAAPLSGAVSWETGFNPGVAAAPVPPPRSSAATAPTPKAMPPSPREASGARLGSASGSQDAAALLDAFRRGLDVPTLELPALTPELMESIGLMMREAVAGTLDLVRARATTKHEMRADVTTIAAKDNNPLKFSPNVNVALQHLLAPPARGFLAAAPAMRETYEDLRAHQFAFVAGMQAVLDSALQRFDPAALETQLGDRSLLQSVLPASRGARLWELFTEHYARIRGDAADEFHKVFGKSFLGAYESHLDRLYDSRSSERPEASDERSRR